MKCVTWWSKALARACAAVLIGGSGCAVPAEDDDDPGGGGLQQGGAGMTAGVPAVPSAGAGGTAMGGAGSGDVGVGMAGMGAPMAGAGGAAGSVAMAGSGGMMGVAGVGGAGGMMGEAGAAGMMAPMHVDLGVGDGMDVITIGDSWMNLILTGIEQSLERISMRDYRNFAVLGTLVLNEQIPGQYASAKAADPDIKTIIMTGGGNDILNDPCTGDACQSKVDQVSARLTTLMAEAGADGVEDIILIGYTYPADTGKHASLDYSIMLSQTSCVTTAVPRCHFIDSTMLDITLADGIHPNAAGYDLIGQTVWELMQARGIRR
jgi:lysophospholipase L1-like esterase